MDNLTTDALPIISIIVALVSLAGVLYGFAVWRGQVDTKLGHLSHGKIPERLVKMETKMDVLWDVFTEQILVRRPGLATRESELKLTDEAKEAVEDVRKLLPGEVNPGLKEKVSERVLVELPHRIGLGKLRRVADKHNMTLGELLAVVSVELGLDLASN